MKIATREVVERVYVFLVREFRMIPDSSQSRDIKVRGFWIEICKVAGSVVWIG
tara:strand:+ start:967 stop:1125 length:159 start_codon:yes stop_codon:yes gene_type:complete